VSWDAEELGTSPKNSPTHLVRSDWLAPFATTAMLDFAYAEDANFLIDSAFRYLFTGSDEVGWRGVPKPR
jgi:hypothetical protein